MNLTGKLLYMINPVSVPQAKQAYNSLLTFKMKKYNNPD